MNKPLINTKLFLIMLTASLCGCASMYFETLNDAPIVESREPSHWPWREYWTGIIFNGEKIGFSHQQFAPDHNHFKISSEAALRLRFMMVDKQYASITQDWVDESLQLYRFEYDYKMDNSRRLVKGQVQGNQLLIEISSQDQIDQKALKFEGRLLPISAIYLYPVLAGLQVGKVFNYQVFDGETLTIHPIKQIILAYQSSDLFTKKAYKIKTEVLGLTTETWLDTRGLPQFELSLRGSLISALETEQHAREYLTQATLAKSDVFLNYSQILPDQKIEKPRYLKSLSVRLDGVPNNFRLMNTSMQTCNKDDTSWTCLIDANPDTSTQPNIPDATEPYLWPTVTVNSTATPIIKLADQITESSTDADAQINRILSWMNRNIEKEVIDSFNSLDVLAQGKAECQGHSLLFAALARSRGIPTRLLNGVVYSDEHGAFLYHTWVESYIDNRWQAIDPTFGQRQADATHIALVEGEQLWQLTALLPLIGRLEININ